MNKKQWMIPLSALLAFGIVGCANNQGSKGVNEKNNNPLRPVGYYSNENHPENQYELLRDNDGALTEMMDHTLGDEDALTRNAKRKMLQTKDENGNPRTGTHPKVQENITDQIRDSVSAISNVRSIRSVFYGAKVIISVTLSNPNKAAETKRAIQKAVKPFADGRSVQVIMDDGFIGRDRNNNNQVP